MEKVSRQPYKKKADRFSGQLRGIARGFESTVRQVPSLLEGAWRIPFVVEQAERLTEGP